VLAPWILVKLVLMLRTCCLDNSGPHDQLDGSIHLRHKNIVRVKAQIDIFFEFIMMPAQFYLNLSALIKVYPSLCYKDEELIHFANCVLITIVTGVFAIAQLFFILSFSCSIQRIKDLIKSEASNAQEK
jgi:hypothetical protein